jgi:tetratricopeptide (TPR) repeat protein
VACPDENTIAELFDGVLSDEARAAVEAHLEACAPCRGIVAAIGAEQSEEDTRDIESTPPTGERPLPLGRGVSVGRYVIVETIGAGSMGLVYLAYDPELDRRVALKCIALDEDAAPDIRRRILDEAKSMARLSHPNVVAVHDVLEAGGAMYIAMEFVAGQTLTEWGEAERGWQEILDVFIPAGQGLAAAHAVGVVHRDFKPDNVLVSDDGRVRVADFGLAALSGLTTGGRDEPEPVEWVGTPRYMAPEQRASKPATAASDQFSFCVALDEFLCREPGRTVGRVPTRIRRAVRRGLAEDPAQRHDGMLELLAELSPRTGRGVLPWAVLAGVAVAGGWAWSTSAEAVEPCPKVTLDGAWTDADREAVAASLESWPDAATWLRRIDDGIGRYLARWEEVHLDACRATRVRKTRSEANMRATMACLEDRQRDLRAVVEVLGELSEEAGPSAIDSVRQLAPIDECWKAVEVDAAASAERASEAFLQHWSRVRALTDAGDFARAMPAADALWDRAQAEPPRAQAQAALAQAWVRVNRGEVVAAEDALHRAAVAADLAGADSIRAEALILSTFAVGYAAARPAEGERIAQRAHALLDRIDAGAIPRARLWRYRGLTFQRQGDFTRAAAAQQRAAEILEQARLRGHPEYAKALIELGNAHRTLRELDRAEEEYRQALEVQRDALGPRHPHVANTIHGLGDVLENQRRHEEALELYEEARAAMVRAFGPEHVHVAAVELAIAQCLLALGRTEEGRAGLEKTVGFYEAHAPDDARRAIALSEMAALRRTAGRDDEALAIMQSAIELRRRVTPTHPDLAVDLHNAGIDQLRTGRQAEALASFTEAAALARAALGNDHELVAVIDSGTGRALHRLGREDEAIAVLEGALEHWRSLRPDVEPHEHFMARITLARALVSLGRERTRAAQLARLALDEYARQPNAESEAIADARRWATKLVAVDPSRSR